VPTAQSSRTDAHIALRQLFTDAVEARAALLFPLAQARVDRISTLPDACLCCILSFLGAASTTAYPSRNSVAVATATSRFARLSATDPRCALALSLTDAYCLTALRRLELSAVKRTHLTDRARHELGMLALVRVLRLHATLSPIEAARAGRLTKCLFGSAQPPVNSWDLQPPALNFDALFEAFAACGTDPSDPTRVRLPHLGVADVTMGAATSAHSLAVCVSS
jgi:hypothetical protein